MDEERPAIGGAQDVFYASETSVPLPIMERAEGIYLWDEHGNEYIDLSSGPIVCNIGHGNAEVVEAMAHQARTLDFAYSRQARHRPNIELNERIARLAGPGFERVSLSSGGSEAMEIAIKFLRQYALATGQARRTKVITCQPSYHGGTIAMLGLSGDEALAPFLRNFAVSSEKVPAPLTYRVPENFTAATWARHCVLELQRKIDELGPDNVLAFVVEPVGGVATGCTVLSDEYVKRVRELCTRHGIALVFDEILCGTGRSGTFLAAHHWPQSLPDLVVLAKGLASGYAPLGATLMPAGMVDRLAALTGFNYSHTYNANPITCATALAVLDVYEREQLADAATARGKQLREALLARRDELPILGDIRGRGLVMALEMVADQHTREPLPAAFGATERVRCHGLEHGLLIYSRRTAAGKYGDWFMLTPPLTISEEECNELARRLTATLIDCYEEYAAGAWQSG